MEGTEAMEKVAEEENEVEREGADSLLVIVLFMKCGLNCVSHVSFLSFFTHITTKDNEFHLQYGTEVRCCHGSFSSSSLQH